MVLPLGDRAQSPLPTCVCATLRDLLLTDGTGTAERLLGGEPGGKGQHLCGKS